MRWRYLILGAMCCIPVATAIQILPPRPMFRIPGGSHYIGDDRAKKQLLFIQIKKDQPLGPLLIERYDADTGTHVSSTTLKWPGSLVNDPKLSQDSSMLRLRSFELDQWNRGPLNIGTHLFDTLTGACLLNLPVYDRKFDALSNVGRYYAMIGVNPHRLVMMDTSSEKPVFELPSPTGKGADLHLCFSPDSRQALLQWAEQDGSGTTLYLVNCETGDEVRRFHLPPGQLLTRWSDNEIGTCEMTPAGGVWLQQYLHSFDGEALGPARRESFLDCDYADWREGRVTWGRDWLCQLQRVENGRPPWADLLMRVQGATKVNLIDESKIPVIIAKVQIIDRATQSVRYEQAIMMLQQCNSAIDGERLIVANQPKPEWILLTGTTSMMPTPPESFEIYSTVGWPRWVWSALGVVGVMSPFVWLARQRHKVAMRRRAAA